MNESVPTLPAFPIVPGSLYESYCDGLSMRDYFAAKAMQMRFGQVGTTADVGLMAMYCYQMADAMMIAREAK